MCRCGYPVVSAHLFQQRKLALEGLCCYHASDTICLLRVLEDRFYVSTVNLMASVQIVVPTLPALPIVYEALHSQATCVFKKSDSCLPNSRLAFRAYVFKRLREQEVNTNNCKWYWKVYYHITSSEYLEKEVTSVSFHTTCRLLEPFRSLRVVSPKACFISDQVVQSRFLRM